MRKTIMQLVRDNLQRVSNSIRCEAAGEEAHVYIYDMIDSYYGVGAEQFVQAMAGVTAPVVHLHINSPGGDVFEARAIATAIKNHSARVVAHIDGVAASAATYIALAADEVRMADGALFMIHQAWSFAYGNSTELRQAADLLDKVDSTIAADYVRKTGASAEQVAEWMAAETWFTAAEAKTAGFIDAIDNDPGEDGDAGAQAKAWNLSAYANAPKVPPKKPAKPLDDAQLLQVSQRNANRLRLLCPEMA